MGLVLEVSGKCHYFCTNNGACTIHYQAEGLISSPLLIGSFYILCLPLFRHKTLPYSPHPFILPRGAWGIQPARRPLWPLHDGLIRGWAERGKEKRKYGMYRGWEPTEAFPTRTEPNEFLPELLAVCAAKNGCRCACHVVYPHSLASPHARWSTLLIFHNLQAFSRWSLLGLDTGLTAP